MDFPDEEQRDPPEDFRRRVEGVVHQSPGAGDFAGADGRKFAQGVKVGIIKAGEAVGLALLGVD